ncbi:hypothetical protein EON63_04895, partial [archaeon]
MPHREPDDEDAAVKLQSIWRGHLGRKAYAHEILQRERGRLKNKKKPHPTPSSSTNKPITQPIIKSSPPKPPRQDSLRQCVEKEEEDVDVPVLKVTKQPLLSSNKNPLKPTISPRNTYSNIHTSTRLSIGSYRDSLEGLDKDALGCSVDSLGEDTPSPSPSPTPPHTHRHTPSQSDITPYESSHTLSPSLPYNHTQHNLSMIEECDGDDMADSLTYTRTPSHTHTHTPSHTQSSGQKCVPSPSLSQVHASVHGYNHTQPHSHTDTHNTSSPSPPHTHGEDDHDPRIVTITRKGLGGASAIPRYVPSTHPHTQPTPSHTHTQTQISQPSHPHTPPTNTQPLHTNRPPSHPSHASHTHARTHTPPSQSSHTHTRTHTPPSHTPPPS